MTKHKVAALLVSAGCSAGFWVIPEFEIARRKIDIVWARRTRTTAGKLWAPVAAFEIEGHDAAPGSVEKNADSLLAASQEGASILAMVLFQIGGDGGYWHQIRPTYDPGAVLRGYCRDGGLPATVQTVRDEDLAERISEWLRALGSPRSSPAGWRLRFAVGRARLRRLRLAAKR
jgi:hypothetical protein